LNRVGDSALFSHRNVLDKHPRSCIFFLVDSVANRAVPLPVKNVRHVQLDEIAYECFFKFYSTSLLTTQNELEDAFLGRTPIFALAEVLPRTLNDAARVARMCLGSAS